MRYVVLSVAFACLYGVVHDQITARICIEYFTVWHNYELVPSTDPTVVGLAWGIFATWWMGLLLGIPLALVCLVGKTPPLPLQRLVGPLLLLFTVMSLGALAAGAIGYYLAPRDIAGLAGYRGDNRREFLACLFAHNASYSLGLVGGVTVIVAAAVRRRWSARELVADTADGQ